MSIRKQKYENALWQVSPHTSLLAYAKCSCSTVFSSKASLTFSPLTASFLVSCKSTSLTKQYNISSSYKWQLKILITEIYKGKPPFTSVTGGGTLSEAPTRSEADILLKLFLQHSKAEGIQHTNCKTIIMTLQTSDRRVLCLRNCIVSYGLSYA